jgi:hypothetical protein
MRSLPSKDRAEKRSIVLPAVPWPASTWKQIVLIEDSAATAQRRPSAGVRYSKSATDVVLRLHRITPAGIVLLAEQAYSPGRLNEVANNRTRAALAVELLDGMRVPRKGALVVAGPKYGGNNRFIEELTRRGFDWVVELPRQSGVRLRGSVKDVPAVQTLKAASWKPQLIVLPTNGQHIKCAVADLGSVVLSSNDKGRLFAVQNGGISGLHNGTIIGLTSIGKGRPPGLIRALGWTRWIRVLDRQYERSAVSAAAYSDRRRQAPTIDVRVRSNITLAREHDERAAWVR